MGPDYSEGMADRSSNDRRSVVARFLDTPRITYYSVYAWKMHIVQA